MSGRKNVLPPYKTISSGSMTGNLTSAITDIRNLDNVAIQMAWTGTPTGTFAVQGSLDYNPQTGSGTWTSLSLSPAPAAAGTADNALIDLNQLSFPYIRVAYTASSGTGTLNVYISGKQA